MILGEGTWEFSSDLLVESLSSMLASGNDRSSIERNVESALSEIGQAEVNADDGTTNWLVADELRLRVRLSISAPVEESRLGTLILAGANRLAPTTNDNSWFGGWSGLRFRHDLAVGAIRDAHRIDGQSVSRPEAAPPRDGLLSGLAQRAFGATTTSTNPARDGQPERAALAPFSGPPGAMPSTLEIGLAVGLIAGGLLTVGYASGGVAALVQAVKRTK